MRTIGCPNRILVARVEFCRSKVSTDRGGEVWYMNEAHCIEIMKGSTYSANLLQEAHVSLSLYLETLPFVLFLQPLLPLIQHYGSVCLMEQAEARNCDDGREDAGETKQPSPVKVCQNQPTSERTERRT